MKPHALVLGSLLLLVACDDQVARVRSIGGARLTPAPALSAPALAAEVYVPIYSSLSFSEGRDVVDLSAQLAIHNTDPKHSIVIDAVRYYDSSGKLLRNEIEKPQKLGAMATTTFFIRRRDTAGGIGANYIVRWSSSEPVSEPLIESVMADLSSSSALAFSSRGVTTRRTEGAPLSD